jgi:hypothetical protein
VKVVILVLLAFLCTSAAQADGIYTDTWVNWTPAGKVFDVVCFSKKNGDKILKDIRVQQFNRKSFQFRDASPDGELKAMNSKGCYFEQKDPHPVSRDEFFEEIVGVKCSLNQLPFKDGDFRILGTNSITTSVKRLRDGKVWILPTNDCTFTTQLQKKPMVPAGPMGEVVQANSELSFPGQSDQVTPPEPKHQPTLPRPQHEATDADLKVKSTKIEKPDMAKVDEPPQAKPVAPRDPNPHGTIKNLINTMN